MVGQHFLGKISFLIFVSGPGPFARYAADIASSLQELRDCHGAFIHRLKFAVRYAQFHHLRMKHDLEGAASDLVAIFHDGFAPKSWWGVLLCDAIELLQCSKPIFIPYGLFTIIITIPGVPRHSRFSSVVLDLGCL